MEKKGACLLPHLTQKELTAELKRGRLAARLYFGKHFRDNLPCLLGACLLLPGFDSGLIRLR